MKKSSKILLCVSLILCLVSGVFASSFMTSHGAVSVEDLRVVVDDGKYITAQIYIPKLASPDNKLPLVVVQHGSYNNYDHQDQNMIELARRGFVVISPDAYNHGNSYVIDGGTQFTNCIHLIDYACASYTFIDLDKVGISGHSMGAGIASETVRHYFEQEATGKGPNRVSAIVDVGYDPQYTPYEFEGVDTPVNLTIDWGVIAAKYDEWFFKDANGDPRGYLKNPNAVAFINQLDGVDVTEVENHKIYKGTIDGEEYIRVINQNTEIHPLNHFSKNSCADMINFFYEAFGVPSGYQRIDANNQIWQWKEFFNFVGLIGIFLFLFPCADMLMSGTTFFAELKQPQPAPAPALNTGKKKAIYWITYAINTIVPALLVVPIAFKLIGKESFVPSTVTQWFGEPNTNELATWTLVVAVCLLAVFLISHFISRDKSEKGIPDCWGVKTGARVLWKSFLLAVCVVTAAYVILFFTDLVFNVDFRIWVIDMRVFDRVKLPFLVAYVPAWALFYLVNSLLVNGGNRVEGRPEWLTMLISCIGNIAGICGLIFIQYSGLISNGTFAYNSMRIVNLFPLVVLIPVGTLISRKFFKETGKIYVGSFLIAILYCLMTVANTMVNATILY